MLNYSPLKKNRTSSTSAKVAKERQSSEKRHLTANPGDRIAEMPQTIEEKSQQLAVDAPDVTGDHIKVPTYFIVKYPNGEEEALHHVRDANKISDVIRQARFEEDWKQQSRVRQTFNVSGIFWLLAMVVLGLFLITVPVVLGVF